MKLVWSPKTASKAYIDTVKLCHIYNDSGVAEVVAAMAAGWNARFIVETWSKGGATAASIGLAVASSHTNGRHVCLVPDERSRFEYVQAVEVAGMTAEVIVGELEESVSRLNGIDFMVVDSQQKDFSKILKVAKLSNKGAVMVCKNVTSKYASSFSWRSIIDDGSRRLVRSVLLPLGDGLDIAHVATNGGNSGSSKGKRRWIKHVDQQSGEEHVIRR